MSALLKAIVGIATAAVVAGCAQGATTADLSAPGSGRAGEVPTGDAETRTTDQVEVPDPLEQPTEAPEGGEGAPPRRTAAGVVPAESLLSGEVLGYSWSVGPDSTGLTGYEVSLCGATPGEPTAQRSRTLTEPETGSTVAQQVRVYDEAAAATLVDGLRAALRSCSTASVEGASATAAEDTDPRLGDESLQVRLRSGDGTDRTFLVVRLREAISVTLIDAGSGEREGTVATVGDLAISALCVATQDGCDS